MRHPFRFSSLIPSGLVVESVASDGITVVVRASRQVQIAACPSCGTSSGRVHSRYERRASDLPCAGRHVLLRIVVLRFRCLAPHCRRQIFAERFGDDVLPPRSRRTTRLECIVHHLGLALGGRPGASFAERLMLPVSNDTLLRVVRRHARRSEESPRVVGVDDWAFRRNHRYERSSATSSAGRFAPSCRTVRSRPSSAGSPATPRSRSCRAIAEAATARRPRGPCQTPSRSPTAGT
jgi:zinc-finger of transposase IS204/IS1001/IS1096/IS1165